MKKHPAVCLLWLILLTVSAFAQEFRATLKGRVTDTQGAAVANATVIVRYVQTNEAASVTTNSEGAYSVSFLKPGIYSITIEASGFKKFVRDRQELQVSQTATIDATLEAFWRIA